MLRSRVCVSLVCLGMALATAMPGSAQSRYGRALSVAPSVSASCATPKPMTATLGINWYTDDKYSVPDTALQAQNLAANKPLFTLMGLAVAPADNAFMGNINRKALACADRNLENWAMADALTERPANSAALSTQTLAVFSLNVMALKRAEAGVPVSARVRAWLHDASIELTEIYAARPQNNLYVWSGAVAATGNLLTRDRALDQYAATVWRAGVGNIGKTGVVDSEAARGQRALVYHQYYNAALGALNLARESAGHVPSSTDRDALSRLNRAIGKWSCDPDSLARVTGEKQEDLSRWSRAMGYAFNSRYLSADWRKCVATIPGFSDVAYGGRFDLTAGVISAGSLTQ